MGDAILWGLIQGLTEFLPISSSGHLTLVPALLGRDGPDLATSAVLHIGTLVAVLAYYRLEVVEMVRLTPEGRRLLRFLIVGTIPAGTIGLLFRDFFNRISEQPRTVAMLLMGAGVMLIVVARFARGDRRREDITMVDAAVIGSAQAVSLLPGVTRSGTTISAGLSMGFERRQAAHLSFLLGIPAIAGAGLISLFDVSAAGGGDLDLALLVGVCVAAVTGYLAIKLLVTLIGSVGLAPFGVYCVAFGGLALLVL